MPAGFPGRPNQMGDRIVTPRALSRKNRKYTFTSFPELGLFAASDGYSAPAGTTGATNRGLLPTNVGGALPIQYFIKGAGQTLVAPSHSASGLRFSLDLTDNEGVDVVFGGDSALGKHAYTIGVDEFYYRLKFTLADVSGTDECLFAARKTQAFQTAHTGYTDYFAVGLTAALGDIVIKTRLNSGTAAETDTTKNFADTETHDFLIIVKKNGSARAVIDGRDPGVNVTDFVFDQGDVIIPTWIFLHATTTPGAADFVEWESGHLSTDERGA